MPEPIVQVVGLRKYFPIRGGVFRRSLGSVRAVDTNMAHLSDTKALL